MAIEAIAMIQFSEEIALPEASLIQYEDIDPFDLTDIRIGLLMIYSGLRIVLRSNCKAYNTTVLRQF
ncbi:MAG TPA: hypothetical protein PKY12_04390, partial [Catalimonadaceae bacterium]|nr:hypothetical protein [Catalimonadaceae bacterium]